MTPKQIRAKRARLDTQENALREKMDRLKREYKKLELECDHPNLQRGHDITGYPERWCDDCGLNE